MHQFLIHNYYNKRVSFNLQDLLRSELPDAIEKSLKGDERCTLDSMRLVDLLLVLLFEGRRALGKSGTSATSGQLMPRIRRMDSAAEKSHRQLIDCIRSKDTDALVEAIESGGVEVSERLVRRLRFCFLSDPISI